MSESTPGGKPVLAFVPGLICDAALWRHQIAAFGDRYDCRVAEVTGHESIGDMAEAVLSALPARFALAGLSMGGYVSFEIVRRAPERVERLALLDTSARQDTPEQRQRRLDLIDLAGRGRFNGVTERLLPLFIGSDRLDDADLVEEVTAMTRRVGGEAFVRQQKAILGRRESLSLLPSIACPTLVLCGRQDVLTPLDCHQEIAAGIPGAELAVIEDCGHLATMERPEAVNAELEKWLGGETGPEPTPRQPAGR